MRKAIAIIGFIACFIVCFLALVFALYMEKSHTPDAAATEVVDFARLDALTEAGE